jgi:trk system potassium uptake protein TrkH
MPIFEAINTAFATAGTGGFGIKNDSFASYSPYLQWVTTIFMILFGVNFNAYYILLFSKLKKNFFMEEVRYYFLIIIGAVGIIFVNILETSQNAFKALTDASFQVASIITTTGFATADFDKWSGTAKTILVLLMFIGACAGSTGGGIKVSRVMIMVKSVFKECNSYIHPKSIKKIKFEGKEVDDDIVRATNVYLVTFLILFVSSVFLISFEGHDLVTNFTAVAATINNIGPGFEMVGPTQNFGFFNDFSKFVLIFDMLAGRLELFPLLILFHHGTWKDIYAHRKALNHE